MIPWDIARTIDLAKWQRGVEHIGVLAYSSNANGHRLTLTILHGGQPESLGGYSIRAYFLLGNPEKPDAMIPKDGAISGNVVTAVFPAAAYSHEQASVMVCAEKTGEQIPLYGARYNVRTGSADKVIDPDGIVPSLPELLAQIDAMKSATADGRTQQEQVAQAEASRVSAEQARVSAEQSRASAEKNRASAESSRVNAEEARATAEQNRASAEQSRVSAESSRANAEKARATAEQNRASAEQNRVSAEQERVTAEQGRASAEQGRVSAEKSRVSAEQARVSEHSTNQKASTEQTARAKAAADKLSEFEVQVESLPPSADPTAKVTQTGTKTTVALGIPTSNFAYATFYINPETRQLVMRVPNGFSAIQFAIQDRRLVVRINGE